MSIESVGSLESLSSIPVERMITFSIIAHIDHGKSSLSQRLLELVGNVREIEGVGQGALDTLQVEKQRGITVKAVTASMVHSLDAGPREGALM